MHEMQSILADVCQSVCHVATWRGSLRATFASLVTVAGPQSCLHGKQA